MVVFAVAAEVAKATWFPAPCLRPWLFFLALPSLWINIRQHCMFLLCWGVCRAALPTPQRVAKRKTPTMSVLTPPKGLTGQHRHLPGAQWTPPWAGEGCRRAELCLGKAGYRISDSQPLLVLKVKCPGV